MSRKFKTSKKNRINYIYYDSNGIKTVLIPEEDGVNEATIEILHQFDDEEVNNNRRETRRHSSIDEINDKSKYIKDLYVDVEEEALSK